MIDAEGIADFPDLNLAESLQRVPGVAVNRDAGEGRTITVRGLSPDFTRVRLNGLEALATTGGKDQASGLGGANRGRGFDFQVFASELFNRVTVRKTQSAELEEGSLGATIDLKTAMPFDYSGLAGAISVDGANNRANNRAVSERDLSGYLQVDFDTEIADMRLRGNIGARYARTRTISGGFVNTDFVRIRHSYDDFLPALNLALEPGRDVVIRLSAAKVMARPQLQNLTPGGSINNTNRSLTTGNPNLEPTRARTLDLNVEWYPDRHTQISAGLFYKDISSFVQTPIVTIPYNQTGFPTSLLANGNTPESLFQVQQATNTRSGSLRGFEIAAQRPFTFLPAPFDSFGAIANFTYVKSRIAYITDASTNPPKTITLPLVGLSKTSWNATLYYERDWFSGRVSGAYRSGYVLSVPGGNGNDARGKLRNFTLDANVTIHVTDKTELTFEALNLTDVFDNIWIDLTRMDIEESTHTGRQFYVGLKYRL